MKETYIHVRYVVFRNDKYEQQRSDEQEASLRNGGASHIPKADPKVQHAARRTDGKWGNAHAGTAPQQ